jgi:hypothetical protein
MDSIEDFERLVTVGHGLLVDRPQPPQRPVS